ncbi:MAG TPA: hypothetical protein VMH20_15895 [Verrucomicrobiae bacterium]|jgi:hypothetical protein|nr:hypothetical protein [Verrucomicrobiae bacterium]
MTVLYFVVCAVIAVPVAVLAIGFFHAKHHHRTKNTTMWHA